MIENKCPSVTIVDAFFGTVKDGEVYDISQHSLPEEFGIYEPSAGSSDSGSFALIYPSVSNYISNGYIKEGILINKNGVFRYSATSRLSSSEMELTRLSRKTVTLTDSSIGSASVNISIDRDTKDEILNADETIIDNGKSGSLYNTMWIGRFVQTVKPTSVGASTIYSALAFDHNYVYRAKLAVPPIVSSSSTLTFVKVS